jgi:hypothetical protein
MPPLVAAAQDVEPAAPDIMPESGIARPHYADHIVPDHIMPDHIMPDHIKPAAPGIMPGHIAAPGEILIIT